MSEVGDRVGALKSANESEVHVYGYGTYEGEKPCPFIGGMENPRIKLDNGDVVWGMECWWGPEDQIKRKVIQFEKEGATVTVVKPTLPQVKSN